MSCIGVLYRTKTEKSPNSDNSINVDLQVNYWKLPRRYYGYWRFLDFGALVHNAKDIESVLFYVPFKLKKENLKDLGSVLVTNNLLSVLFNDSYKIEDNPEIPGYHFASTTRDVDKSGFWVYSLSASNFEVHDLSVGTLIEVDIKTKPNVKMGIQNADNDNKEDNYNLYFRFRIGDIPDGALGYIESVSNDFFQNAFSKAEIVNLDINTISEMDDDDYKDIVSRYSFVSFNKIHFFFVASSKEETIYGSTDYSDSRLLDSRKWGLYIDSNNPQQRKCIAYHWKKSEPTKNCNILLRTIYSSLNICTILKYVFVVLLLGVLASYIASCMSPKCDCQEYIEKVITERSLSEPAP
mgnify:CR=1 FL=1